MKLMLTLILVMVFSLTYGQRVGIGLTNPLEKLHVDSSIKIGVGAWSSATHNRYLKFGDGNNVTIGEVGLDDRLEFSAREFLFRSNGVFPNTGKVGININTSPAAYLDVNGDVKITDGTQGNERVLTSDATGKASWKDIPGKGTGFHANLTSSNLIIAPNTDYPVVFNNRTIVDEGFGYGISNGLFTAPSDGVYAFNVKIRWSLDNNTQANLTVWIERNGSTIEEETETVNGSGNGNIKTISFGTVVKLGALDVIRVYVRQQSGDNQQVMTNNSSFSGYRVH